MAADLVVADDDLLTMPLKKISKAKSRLTMVDGRVVHRSPGL
jgi:predicted amidohydrolase YtcJ